MTNNSQYFLNHLCGNTTKRFTAVQLFFHLSQYVNVCRVYPLVFTVPISIHVGCISNVYYTVSFEFQIIFGETFGRLCKVFKLSKSCTLWGH